MVSLIDKQLLLTAYAYLFLVEQQKAQQGSEALRLQTGGPAGKKPLLKGNGRRAFKHLDIKVALENASEAEMRAEFEDLKQKFDLAKKTINDNNSDAERKLQAVFIANLQGLQASAERIAARDLVAEIEKERVMNIPGMPPSPVRMGLKACIDAGWKEMLTDEIQGLLRSDRNVAELAKEHGYHIYKEENNPLLADLSWASYLGHKSVVDVNGLRELVDVDPEKFGLTIVAQQAVGKFLVTQPTANEEKKQDPAAKGCPAGKYYCTYEDGFGFILGRPPVTGVGYVGTAETGTILDIHLHTPFGADEIVGGHKSRVSRFDSSALLFGAEIDDVTGKLKPMHHSAGFWTSFRCAGPGEIRVGGDSEDKVGWLGRKNYVSYKQAVCKKKRVEK